MAKHWYRVDFHEGTKERMLCGSSALNPEDLIAHIAAVPFLRLDDLFYRDSQNRFRPWSEWDARLEPMAYINTKCISSVMTFAGDPFAGAAAVATGAPDATPA